jgi:hypothetical protein
MKKRRVSRGTAPLILNIVYSTRVKSAKVQSITTLLLIEFALFLTAQPHVPAQRQSIFVKTCRRNLYCSLSVCNVVTQRFSIQNVVVRYCHWMYQVQGC